MDYKEIFQRLAAPFKTSGIEWRLQAISEENMQGLAIPYIQSRAIQNRLDEVLTPAGWKNEYILWHTNSQLCNILVRIEYGDGTAEWVGKSDGSGNSDIEPIKGGLSDAMKRAAVQWGIGRFLYQMGSIWVNVEKHGKSFVIAKSEQSKLDDFYNKEVERIANGLPAGKNTSGDTTGNTSQQALKSNQTSQKQVEQKNLQTQNTAKQKTTQTPGKSDTLIQDDVNAGVSDELYFISDMKTSSNEYGESTQVKLVEMNSGAVVEAFVKGQALNLFEGVKLCNVKLTLKNGKKRDYYTLDSYDIAA